MVRFITPAMSSSSDYERGSVEWVDRRAQVLLDRFRSIQQNGIRPFARSLEELVETVPAPWDQWPPFPDGPARTIDRFCKIVLDLEFEAVCDLIASYDPQAAQKLRSRNAETEAKGIKRGGDHGNQHTGGKLNNIKVAEGPTPAYLLRRLARERPDILGRYKMGEFKSARAAARAAGFVIPRATIPSDMPLEALAAQLKRRFTRTERRRLAGALLADHTGGSDPTKNSPEPDPWSDIACEMRMLLQAEEEEKNDREPA